MADLRLKIKGGTWPQRVLVHAGALFYAKRMGWRNRVTINLILTELPKHKLGDCVKNTTKSYTIRLPQKLKPVAMMKSLAHEMIHVHQWLSGHMEDMDAQRVRWGKKIYYPNRMKYRTHPWEIQAYRGEDELYRAFIRLWVPK